MGWKDRLIMKILGNKLAIKTLNMPIVLKVLMWETKVFMSVISLFTRKKEAAG